MNKPLVDVLSEAGVLDDESYLVLDDDAIAWSDTTILGWLEEEKHPGETLMQTMLRKLKKLYRLECQGM